MRFEARERLAVTAEKLWPLVSDTQRLNRVMGLPVIRFTTEPLATGGSRVIGEHPLVSAALAMIGQVFPLDPRRVTDEALLRHLPKAPIVRWIEHPFEWVVPHRHAVLREYFWSPLGLFPFRSFYGGVELHPVDGGTEVIAFADIEPRNLLGALLTRFLLGPRNVAAVMRQCQVFERYLLGRETDPFPQLVRRVAPGSATAPRGESAGMPPSVGDETEVRSIQASDGQEAGSSKHSSAWRALMRAGIEPNLVERLREHLLGAPDEDVLKMRPFALADRWSAGRRETLVMFLHATTAGLLEMSWDVLCPNCRLGKAYESLADLPAEGHCDACNVSFDALIDRQVEVRFTVSATVRQVKDRRFCSGGPVNVPHVIAQTEVAPDEVGSVRVDLSAGTYRLRSPQSKMSAVLEVTGEPPPQAEVALGLGPGAIQPPLVAALPGTIHLTVRNLTDVSAAFVLERPEWPDDAATAAVVGTLQEFRDLFGTEVLAPGLQLAIQRLAFLFTDLAGSTALYQSVGQARAFRLVQDHFQILGRAIAAHEGALVKTIGDAVMASFPTGGAAFDAALEMQRKIRGLESGGAVDTARLLKAGIHEGPCIAVGANGLLDYFGTTINLAARVQHESRGGEVMLSEEVYSDPVVQQRLRDTGLAAAEDQTLLRGIRDPVKLYRIDTNQTLRVTPQVGVDR
jgi:adenylate cyclase